mgnify:CR=1 FL=1
MRGIHDYRSSCIIHTSTLWPKHESILLVGFLFCASFSCFYLLKKYICLLYRYATNQKSKLEFFAPDVLFGKLSHSILFTYEWTGFSTQSCFKLETACITSSFLEFLGGLEFPGNWMILCVLLWKQVVNCTFIRIENLSIWAFVFTTLEPVNQKLDHPFLEIIEVPNSTSSNKFFWKWANWPNWWLDSKTVKNSFVSFNFLGL